MAPEALFDPALVKEVFGYQYNDYEEGIKNEGMSDLCHKSVMDCDVDIRRDLYQNVMLSGGSTLFRGLPERLQKELDAVCP